MNIERKIQDNLVTAKDLGSNKTYKCVKAPRQDYLGNILLAREYYDMYGVWLTSPGVLSKLTVGLNAFRFKEIQVHLVEE